MECSAARELLDEYFEGTLPALRRKDVAAHLEQCAACAAELEQIERLAVTLAGAPRVEPREELLRAITARAAELPTPGSRWALVAGWRRMAVAAAAVTAAVAGVRYGGPMVWSRLAVALAPGVTWLGKQGALALAWMGPKVEGIGVAAGAVWEVVAALGSALATAWPAMAWYAAGEAAVVAGMILAIHWGRRAAGARIGTLVV